MTTLDTSNVALVGKPPFWATDAAINIEKALSDPQEFAQAFAQTNLCWAIDVDAPVHPEYMKVNTWADTLYTDSYQWGTLCNRARCLFSEVFHGDPLSNQVLAVYAPSGTAANRITTSAVLDSASSLIVAENSHVIEREAGSVVAQTGSTVHIIPNDEKLITADVLDKFISDRKQRYWVTQQPKVFSITNPTEDGRVYSPAQLKELAEVCHRHSMLFQMDGARIYLAAARLNVSLKELTTDCNVDMLALGGAKCGMHKAEVAIFLPSFFEHFGKLHLYKNAEEAWNPIRSLLKRHGNLMGQSAGVAAQFLRAFTNDFALNLARTTNSRAAELAEKIVKKTSFQLFQPVETNLVLVSLPKTTFESLSKKFPEIMVWRDSDPKNADNIVVRFISNYGTTTETIDETVSFLGAY